MNREMNNNKAGDERQRIVSAFRKGLPKPDVEEEWQKVSKKIAKNEKKDKKIYFKSHSRVYQNSNRKLEAFAAGLLLLFALSASIVIYMNDNLESDGKEMSIKEVFQEYEFITEYGEKRTFALSDGSKILLNANSKLTFNSTSQAGDVKTEVWLQGEAFFDITHLEGDEQRTFTVHTSEGSVEVLGTRFLVNTYEGNTKAVLEEGKIAVRLGSQHENASQQKIYYMEPGNIATFNSDIREKGITIKRVDTKLYTSWTHDKMVFDQTPITEVAKRIKHYYGIDVIIGKSAADIKLSGSIKTDSLEILTEALNKIIQNSNSNNNINLKNNTLNIQ